MANRWREIPRSVIADQSDDLAAQTWGDEQRSIAVKAWADTARQQAYALANEYGVDDMWKQEPEPQSFDVLTKTGYGYEQPGDDDPFRAERPGPDVPSFFPPMRGPMGSMLPPPPIQGAKKPPPSEQTQEEVVEGDADPFEVGVRESAEMVGSQLQTSPAAAGAVGGRMRRVPDEAGAGEGVGSLARMASSGAKPGGGSAIGKAIALTAEEEVVRLRLDKFPEALRDTIQQAATEGDFWRTQRRGVISDELAEKMADDLGRSVDQMIAGGKAGKAYAGEGVRALRNSLTSQAIKVNDLAAQIAEAPHDAGRGLIARAIAEGQKMADLSRVVEGARAESGRGLRAWQGFTRDYAKNPEGAIERIFKSIGGPDEALKAVTEYQKMVNEGANAAQLASFWARAERPPVNVLDWWELNRMTSMLSGPRTLVINALGAAVELPWKLAGDFTEAVVVRRNPAEVVPEIKAMWGGLKRGVDNAMETIAYGITNEAAEAGALPRGIANRLQNPVAKAAATALEAPLRLQQATDEIGLSIAYSMEIARRAGINATAKGLKGTAWKEAVADGIENPPPTIMKQAKTIADEMTMRGDMGNLGRALGQVQKVPIVGPAVFPFLKTVYHITARGVDRSPLGLVGTGVDVARGVYKAGKELPQGVRPLDRRLRDNVMGSAATIWFYDQATRGNVTGKGPGDKDKRAMLEAQGWMPYAIKLGGEYHSYSNWGAIATPLAMAAGAAEAQMYAKPSDSTVAVAADAVGRTMEMFAEQNYLQGVGAIFKTFTDFERYGHQWLQNYLQTIVLMGAAVNTVGQATDPLIRKPERGNFAEGMAGRFPGLREGLPAKQDVLGRDVENEMQGLASANPIRSREGRPSDVLQVLTQYGVDLPATAPTTRGNITMTRDEQSNFQRTAGTFIEQAVRRVVADPAFDGLPVDRKKRVLRAAVDGARERAEQALLRSVGPAIPARRAETLAAR